MPLPKIALTGASGRMGRLLLETLLNDQTVQLVGALDHRAQIPYDVGAQFGRQTGVFASNDIEAVLVQAEYLIDFTHPETLMTYLPHAQRRGVKLVIGTTGFTFAQNEAIRQASHRLAVVWSPNMSVGVNIVFKLLNLAAQLTQNAYDVEIIEAHHRYKLDAPSGTALKMGDIVAQTIGHGLSEVSVFDRSQTGQERKPGSIGFSVVRAHSAVYWARRMY